MNLGLWEETIKGCQFWLDLQVLTEDIIAPDTECQISKVPNFVKSFNKRKTKETAPMKVCLKCTVLTGNSVCGEFLNDSAIF